MISEADGSISDTSVITVNAAASNEPKMKVSPEQVKVDNSFNQTFTLTIENDTLAQEIYLEYISLGGVFEELNVSNVGKHNDSTVTAAVYGNLSSAGTGKIILDADALTNCKSSLTVDVPVLEDTVIPITYTVTFKDWDGKVLKTETVEEGESATAPLEPEREGYEFTGWDIDFTNVQSNLTVVAQYKVEPTTPDSLVLWLDANDYDSSTGIWTDKSGKGNSVVQNTTGNQPSKVADGMNGKPVVRFDGSNDYLNLNWEGDSLTTDSLTMFLVLKNNNMSGGSQTIMGNYDQKDEVVIHKSGNSPYPITAGISTPIRDNRVTLTTNAGPYVLTYKYDHTSTTHAPFVDGVLGTTRNNRVNINWNNTTIGRNGGPTGNNISEWHWNGDVAEIRIYNIALTSTEQAAIEQELHAKWFEVDAAILYNPYEKVNWDAVKQYKANFHTHTNQSDGGSTPAQVIDAYHDAGYDILVLTDHDNMGGAQTTWPWTKWDRNPTDLEMLTFQGNEISSTDHICSYFNDYGGASYGQEEQALQKIQQRNGLASMNHPGRQNNRPDTWYKELYEKYYQAPLIGMEVYNQGNRYPNDRELWDRVNALVMPEIMIFGYSNDDMHQINSHTFRNYQFMLMEELTEEALKACMLDGAFYFCYEPGRSGGKNPPVPRIEEIQVTQNDTVITITANNADTITWRTNKGVAGSGNSIDITTLDLKGAKFIRAELANQSGKTYTQPFVLQVDEDAITSRSPMGIQGIQIDDTQFLNRQDDLMDTYFVSSRWNEILDVNAHNGEEQKVYKHPYEDLWAVGVVSGNKYAYADLSGKVVEALSEDWIQ